MPAAEAGTTSLYYYLSQHPDICMSHPKEPMYFWAEYESGSDFYLGKYFKHWNGQSHVGEASHRNLFFPFVPSRIA